MPTTPSPKRSASWVLRRTSTTPRQSTHSTSMNTWLISGITNLASGPKMQTGVSFSAGFYMQGTISGPNGTYAVSNQTILGTPDVNLQPTLKCDPRSGL